MSNLPNLSGSTIQDTYQRVLHTDGSKIYDGIGNVVLESIELSSLQTMNNNTIENGDWSYVATMNQSVADDSNPVFASMTVGGSYAIKSGGGVYEAMNFVNDKVNFPNSISTEGIISQSKSEGENIFGADITVYGRIRTVGSEVSINTGSIYATNTIEASDVLTTNLIATGKVKIKGSDIELENGNISASGYISSSTVVQALTGSFGTNTTTITDKIVTTGDIEAAAGVITGKIIAAGDIRAVEGKNEITLGEVNKRITAIINGDIRVKGSDLFIGSGSISASGDIFCTQSIVAGGNVSAGDGGTGSFDHIITTTGSIEFRDGNTTIGFMKMSNDGEGLRHFNSSRVKQNRVADKIAGNRRIGGVLFDGLDNISLPGVNIAGTQDTSGNAATVTNGVYTTGNQTIAGTKTFSSAINGDLKGNARSATTTTTYKNSNKYLLTPSDFLMHRTPNNFGTAGSFLSLATDERAYCTWTMPLGSGIWKQKMEVVASNGSFTMSMNTFNGSSQAVPLTSGLVNVQTQIGGLSKNFNAEKHFLSIEFNTPPGAGARLYSAYVDWII